MRQELTPPSTASSKPAPEPEPTPSGGTLPTPPRPQGLADAPPHPVHCPMPSVVAAIDSPNATVRLRLSVDEDGAVTEATILTSSGIRVLDDAALDAVGLWEYDPAVRNGRNVPGVVIETVKFSRRR